MLHARPEPSHSGRFAFNCALPLSSGPFRRPVKALLALKEDFSEYARPGRRRCHVYDGRGFQRSGQVGARKMDATGRIRGTTRVSRGKRGTVYCVRFERGWRGESGSSTSDRAPFRRTPSGRDLPSLQLINSRDQFRVFLDFHS